MKKKLIITESQLQRLKVILSENNSYQNMVKEMKHELDTNYEVAEKYVKEGGDYTSETRFMVKVDEEVITAKNLFEYFKNKYDAGDDFIQQVIKDWVDGKITDSHGLSKNVPMN